MQSTIKRIGDTKIVGVSDRMWLQTNDVLVVCRIIAEIALVPMVSFA